MCPVPAPADVNRRTFVYSGQSPLPNPVAEIVRPCRTSSFGDIELRPLRAVLEDTVYRGRDAIDQWMRDVDEALLELDVEVEETHEPVPGYVVAFATLHARGHESAAPTSMPVALTAHVRDGLVTHAATTLDRDAAMRAPTGA
jgi:ketosteroid isomerase-like protein